MPYKNPALKKERAAEYRRENAERIRDYHRQWFQKNKERNVSGSTKEERSEYQKKWREHYSEYQKMTRDIKKTEAVDPIAAEAKAEERRAYMREMKRRSRLRTGEKVGPYDDDDTVFTGNEKWRALEEEERVWLQAHGEDSAVV